MFPTMQTPIFENENRIHNLRNHERFRIKR